MSIVSTMNSFSCVMVACGHCIQLADSTKLVTLRSGARQGEIPSSRSLFLIVYAAQKTLASSCELNQSDLRCEDCSVTAAMRNKHWLQLLTIFTFSGPISPSSNHTALNQLKLYKCVWPKMYLYCIAKLCPTLFNQEVMQKSLFVHPPHICLN